MSGTARSGLFLTARRGLLTSDGVIGRDSLFIMRRLIGMWGWRRHCCVRLDALPWIVYKTCNVVGAFTDLSGASLELRSAPSRVAKAICSSNCDHRCGFGTADISPYQQSERAWLLCVYPNSLESRSESPDHHRLCRRESRGLRPCGLRLRRRNGYRFH